MVNMFLLSIYNCFIFVVHTIHKTITIAIPVDCTEQSKVKRQRAREKYASMPADKKAELNAKRRESYYQKKPEREAARNDTKNLGIIFTTRHISM